MNDDKKLICLISPPARANSYVVPFALLHLSAWLQKDGMPSNIIDLKRRTHKRVLTKKDMDDLSQEIVKQLADLQPAYVGITCYTYDYNTVMKLAQLIKERIKTKIIIGGMHATLKPYDFMFIDSPVDFIVQGDGEIALTEFLKKDRNNESLDNVPGLGYKDSSGRYKINENNSVVDYGFMPMLPYDKVDMAFYTTPNRTLIRYLYASGIHIMTTKGCPYSCTFCANRAHKVLYRSIHTVVDEIAMLKSRYGIDSFYIQDDTFGIKRERIIQFLNELQSRKIKLFWGMETRVNLLDDELAAMLVNSGCIQIDFGVESGSQTSLDRMQKGIKVEDTIKAFDICHKYHIRTLANVMFNTPEENRDDVDQTIKLIKKIRPTVLGILLTVPLPGTQIHDQYVNPAIEKSEYHLFEDSDMYATISDKRFKLAKHDINLPGLRKSLVYKYMFPRMILDMTSNIHYWKVLAMSKKKLEYINCMLEVLFFSNLWRISRYISKFFNGIRKIVLSL